MVMDALNLLKFWRNAGSVVISDVVSIDCKKNGDDVSNQAVQIGNETDDDDSFFELVLAAPECNEDGSEKRVKGGFSFVDSPKDVFSNKKVFPVDANESKPQSPIALLKSAPKFRVFMLGLKRSKLEKTETSGGDFTATPKPEQNSRKCSGNGRNKRFAVRCRFEEAPSVSSSFTPDNSLRNKLLRESLDEFPIEKASSKRFEKDEVPKYLKLIKPFYDRASKKHAEKTRFSDYLSAASPMSSPAPVRFTSPRKAPDDKPVNRATSLKVVYKHLGKSRSTSSFGGMTPSPLNRRDDSLLQQHDGIQSAILHCKRSYNSSSTECSTLWRCSSDASHDQQRDYTLELNRCSI